MALEAADRLIDIIWVNWRCTCECILKDRSARKKPLLQNRHKKARLRFATAHGDKDRNFGRNVPWSDENRTVWSLRPLLCLEERGGGLQAEEHHPNREARLAKVYVNLQLQLYLSLSILHVLYYTNGSLLQKDPNCQEPQPEPSSPIQRETTQSHRLKRPPPFRGKQNRASLWSTYHDSDE